ncbi:hypothetical protein E4U60_007471 [Claviceps pazoutovae]|uniref:Uncharacterized protein n=1 Tax=Claviceps pazoutovae TaxID=1649127 RepID=A0A9P7M445_9HYPO|nr:hypothetical protein E4U60_007471 [Claviceps pazoutovae]
MVTAITGFVLSSKPIKGREIMKSLPTLYATNLTVSGTCGPEDISSVQFPIDDHTVAMTLVFRL